MYGESPKKGGYFLECTNTALIHVNELGESVNGKWKYNSEAIGISYDQKTAKSEIV